MNPVSAYKSAEGISLTELAQRLGIKSKSHAGDLVRGRRQMSVAVARRLGELSGRPWHELLDGA